MHPEKTRMIPKKKITFLIKYFVFFSHYCDIYLYRKIASTLKHVNLKIVVCFIYNNRIYKDVCYYVNFLLHFFVNNKT